MQRVILADESEDFRLILSELLEDRYDVVCCADGAQALELLRKEKTDLIVLGLTMPGLDGMGLLKCIRHEGLASSVIVTGRLFSDYAMEPRISVNLALERLYFRVEEVEIFV